MVEFRDRGGTKKIYMSLYVCVGVCMCVCK